MASVRPLRELLTDLVGDDAARADGPAAYLAAHGHTDLPPDLVAEAVVSFADTAPPEVAERLAPFVAAHTDGEETVDWFDLLTTAQPDLTESDELDADPEPWTDFGTDPGPGLDFGAGSLDEPDEPDLPDLSPSHATDTDWPEDTFDEAPAEAVEPDAPAQPIVLDDDDTDDDTDED